MKFFTLILSFELIIAPLVPSLSFLPLAIAQQNSCPQGTTYNSALNRCLTSQEIAGALESSQECAPDDKDCFRENARDALESRSNTTNDVPSNSKWTSGDDSIKLAKSSGNALAVAIPLYAGTQMLRGLRTRCNSPSLYAMVGGGVSLLAGEALSNLQHKNRLKGIQDDWNNLVNPSGEGDDLDTKRQVATEAQSEAFEMLARQEDSMKKAAHQKSIFFSVATAAFAASAILATFEAIQNPAGICKTNETDNSPPASSTDHPSSSIKDSPETPKGKMNLNLFPDTSFIRERFKENIMSSKNFASFMVLHEHSLRLDDVNHSPTLDQYESYQKSLRDSQIDQQFVVLDLIKKVYKGFFSGLSLSSEAFAQDTTDLYSYEYTSPEVSVTAKRIQSPQKEIKTPQLKIPERDHSNLNIPVVKEAKRKASLKLSKLIRTPVTRAILSGLLGGWAGFMTNHAVKQTKASEERAKILRNMKEQLHHTARAVYPCSAESRSNPNEPNCYCYLPEGGRNPNRTNSGVCNRLWAQTNLKSTRYGLGASGTTRTCITRSGSLDQSCSCRKTKEGCLKATPANLKSLNIGSFSMGAMPLATIDGIANGSIDSASLNAEGFLNKAASMRKATEDLQKKLPKLTMNTKKNLENKMTTALTAAGRRSGVSSPFLGRASSPLPKNPNDAVASLKKELKEAISSGPNNIASPNDYLSVPKEEMDFDFGLNQEDLAVQESKIAEIMDENLEYGNNDITSASDTDIFEILSNRYMRSGMRRLFDESRKLRLDAPAKSDISK